MVFLGALDGAAGVEGAQAAEVVGQGTLPQAFPELQPAGEPLVLGLQCLVLAMVLGLQLVIGRNRAQREYTSRAHPFHSLAPHGRGAATPLDQVRLGRMHQNAHHALLERLEQ